MKEINELYNTLKPDFSPQSRSLSDLALILSKAYILYKKKEYFQFARKNSFIDKTTIERLISELNSIKLDNLDNFFLESEGIELSILTIRTLELNSSYNSNELEDNFIMLKTHILYLIQIARQSLIQIKQKKITNKISNLKNNNQRINYLNSLVIEMKQYQKMYDNIQYSSLVDFIQLELEKWNLTIEEKNDQPSFKSELEFQNYIIKLINEKLSHNIIYLEGYRNFWRDEKCIETPKKENEIQPFIKTILKPYCDNIGIKIHRESSVSNGRIDMTFTYFNYNICLEVKKAHHNDVLKAVNTQLPEYMRGEETDFGIYLILWYKSNKGFEEPKTYKKVGDLISDIVIENKDYKINIIGIDCSKPISPSKL